MKLFKGLLVVMMIVLMAGLVLAQETANLTGTITDPTGAVIPNAKLTIVNTNTNATRTQTSDANGHYTFTGLVPGPYQLTVTAQGFATAKQNMDLTVGARAANDVRLRVASGGSTLVEVTATGDSAVEVNTSDQTVATTITPTQVMSLPSLTRNPYDFVLTAGNVTEGDPNDTTRGVGVNMNGQRSASTNILLDGTQNVDLFSANVGQQIPLDSVQEYKVLTSDFTAEYGRASGGVVNLSTKSGTNNLHGSAYEYNRVSALASNTYQTNSDNYIAAQNGDPLAPKARFTRNQFGYSLGGPIKKDKVFFFSNTEWTRVRSNANITSYVFTPEFIGKTGAATQSYWGAYGALSSAITKIGTPVTAGQLAPVNSAATPCVNPAAGLGVSGWTNIMTTYNTDCTIKNAGSPNFQTLAQANPTLPVLQLVSFSVPYDSGAGTPQNTWNTVLKGDFNLSNNTTLWARYAAYHEFDFDGSNGWSPYQGFDTGYKALNQNLALNLTHVFSPSIVNQTKLTYNRLNQLQPLGEYPPVPSLYLAASVPSPNSFPVYLPGYLPNTQSNAIPFGGPQNLYQISDQVTISKGKHNFSFGGEYVQTRDNRVFGAYEEGIADLANNSGKSLDAMLAGTIYSYQVAVNPQGVYPCPVDIATGTRINTANCTVNLPMSQPAFNRNNRFNDFSLFGQDSWRVNHRLTLNLGLRWEYYGVQHNTNPNLDSNFYYPGDIATPQSVRAGYVTTAPNAGGLWNSSPANFGPRFGFAYDLTGDGKTSLRGGYGIAYERNFGNVTFNVIQNPPNYGVLSLASSTTPSSSTFPVPVNNLGPFGPPATGSTVLPAVTLRAVDPNINTAYSQMYSLSLEREIMPKTLVAAEFTGSRGEHLYSITNINRYYGGPTYNGDSNLDPPTSASYGATRTNTTYGNINFRGSDGDSYYNALNMRLQSNNFLNKGLQFTFNYTWSHAIDDLSSTFSDTAAAGYIGQLGFMDWTNPGLDRASADFDERHRVAFSAVYAPTFKFQNKAAEMALGGWSVAPIFRWHSGTPFTLFDCGYAYGNCARPLVEDNAGSYTPITATGASNEFNYFTYGTYNPYVATVNGAVVGGGVADNPSCTGSGSSYHCAFPSNMLGRNTGRAPGAWFMNLGIYKNFKLTERYQLQFRTEMYNLFNHSNYYLNFGTTDVQYESPITLNKGNGTERRNVQFALRFTF